MSKLKTQSEAEIRKALTDTRARLQAFRFAVSGSKTRNVKEARVLRREIARFLTELRGRAISK